MQLKKNIHTHAHRHIHPYGDLICYKESVAYRFWMALIYLNIWRKKTKIAEGERSLASTSWLTERVRNSRTHASIYIGGKNNKIWSYTSFPSDKHNPGLNTNLMFDQDKLYVRALRKDISFVLLGWNKFEDILKCFSWWKESMCSNIINLSEQFDKQLTAL